MQDTLSLPATSTVDLSLEGLANAKKKKKKEMSRMGITEKETEWSAFVDYIDYILQKREENQWTTY